LVFLLAFSGAALANGPSLSNSMGAIQKNVQVEGVANPQPQVGGEDIATAANIPALPYSDSGNTCGYVNDYDEVCPYTGSLSGDVVYKYSPAANIALDITLCQTTLYDTKLYVYENSTATLVGCNDDAGCGYLGSYSSELLNVAMTAGNTYYIVVDGYASDCGDYILDVTEHTVVPPCVECPANAIPEGEPFGGCATNYTDAFNGGCNSVPPVFSAVPCTDPGMTTTICGGMGGFTYFGSSYRDTDWYLLEASVNTGGVTACVLGGADFVLGYITVQDCANVSAFDDYVLGTGCTQACINVPAGEFWLFVGANGFGDTFGCHEYVLEISGYDCGIVSVEPASWGEIKGQYR
jgi:hypothetical protein